MKLIEQLVGEVSMDLADLRRVHGGLPSLRGALERICTRLQKGELFRALSNADKRELAIDAALMVIEKHVPPGWIGWLTVAWRRRALGWMVDQVVAAFKKKGWPALEAP